jgi:hypothetical protein
MDPRLPDGLFQTKNPNLDKFWRALDWKMLLCFMFFGIMHQEKPGNPAKITENYLPLTNIVGLLPSYTNQYNGSVFIWSKESLF